MTLGYVGLWCAWCDRRECVCPTPARCDHCNEADALVGERQCGPCLVALAVEADSAPYQCAGCCGSIPCDCQTADTIPAPAPPEGCIADS